MKAVGFLIFSLLYLHYVVCNVLPETKCNDGDFAPVKGDCTKFTHCANNILWETQCPAAQVWSQEKHTCVPDIDGCSSGSGSGSGSSSPQLPDTEIDEPEQNNEPEQPEEPEQNNESEQPEESEQINEVEESNESENVDGPVEYDS